VKLQPENGSKTLRNGEQGALAPELATSPERTAHLQRCFPYVSLVTGSYYLIEYAQYVSREFLVFAPLYKCTSFASSSSSSSSSSATVNGRDSDRAIRNHAARGRLVDYLAAAVRSSRDDRGCGGFARGGRRSGTLQLQVVTVRFKKRRI
jgi:hypothetical protein